MRKSQTQPADDHISRDYQDAFEALYPARKAATRRRDYYRQRSAPSWGVGAKPPR